MLGSGLFTTLERLTVVRPSCLHGFKASVLVGRHYRDLECREGWHMQVAAPLLVKKLRFVMSTKGGAGPREG